MVQEVEELTTHAVGSMPRPAARFAFCTFEAVFASGEKTNCGCRHAALAAISVGMVTGDGHRRVGVGRRPRSGLPNKADSFKFAVIGDFGTGDRPSYEVAAQMAALRARFSFEIVITTGDNIIGDRDDPSDLAKSSSARSGRCPTRGSASASLGNHDKRANLSYPNAT